MNLAIAFTVSFVAVFFKALQNRNYNFDNYALIVPTSWGNCRLLNSGWSEVPAAEKIGFGSFYKYGEQTVDSLDTLINFHLQDPKGVVARKQELDRQIEQLVHAQRMSPEAIGAYGHGANVWVDDLQTNRPKSALRLNQVVAGIEQSIVAAQTAINVIEEN